MASLEIPVIHKVAGGGPQAGGETVEVAVWKDACLAVDQGNAAALWLSSFLDMVNGQQHG